MSLLDLIRNLFRKEGTQVPGIDNQYAIFPGVLVDDRSDAERLGDIKAEELFTAAPVTWTKKRPEELRVFKVQDQAGQSSCVANAGRKALSIILKVNHDLDVDPSSLDIYRRRENYPKPGMVASDLWNITKKGVTLNSLVPSDGKTEAYANELKVPLWKRQVGDIFKTGDPVLLPTDDIDAVASVIQETGKGVVLFYYFTRSEWAVNYPEVITQGLVLRADTTLRHAVTAVDFTLTPDGKKALVIEDSAHFGGINRRFITEDFHKRRCFYAGYTMNFVFDAPKEKQETVPSFSKDMLYGQQSKDVAILQMRLQDLGLFPKNVSATGYYGALTARCVLDFQRKHTNIPREQIESLAGRIVGPATREALNTM